MIEEILEIFIITYNRSEFLENTLKQLVKSPFANCNFTILDNCSEDETPCICEKYKKLFHNMKIIRHKKNIGANPNYLHAVELSKSKYTWILCDDDYYDFSEYLDIFEAILSEKFDLISVGHPNYSDWRRGIESTVIELIENSSTSFTTFTFIPSSIFKTELFDSYCLIQGYFNSSNFFPSFEFINKSIEENFSVYVSKKEIVNRIENVPHPFPALELISGWLNSCALIHNKKIRLKAAREFPPKVSYSKFIIGVILNAKIISHIRDPKKHYLSLISGCILTFGLSKEIFLVFIIIILIIIPSFIYKQARKAYLIIRYGKQEYNKRNGILNDKDFDRLRT